MLPFTFKFKFFIIETIHKKFYGIIKVCIIRKCQVKICIVRIGLVIFSLSETSMYKVFSCIKIVPKLEQVKGCPELKGG